MWVRERFQGGHVRDFIRDFCGFCVGDFLGRYSEEILGDIFVWILWDFGIFKGKVGNIFQHLMMSALSNLLSIYLLTYIYTYTNIYIYIYICMY